MEVMSSYLDLCREAVGNEHWDCAVKIIPRSSEYRGLADFASQADTAVRLLCLSKAHWYQVAWLATLTACAAVASTGSLDNTIVDHTLEFVRYRRPDWAGVIESVRENPSGMLVLLAR